MKSVDVSELSVRFLEWVAKRRKPNTHKFYAGRLAAFDRMLGNKKCHKLKTRDFEEFLLSANHWPDGRPKAADTIRANMVSVEQWQKFALKEKAIDAPLIEDLDKPVGRNRERLPTAEEVDQLKADFSREFNLVYEALRRSGARPNELARATVADWDRVSGMIVLADHKTATKTGQPRRIAVGDKLRDLILESLGERTSGRLFLSPQGRSWTTESLSATFRRSRNKLGLDRQIVLYCTRHEHGTAVYHAFGELAAATALGHKGTGMISKYAKIPPAKRRETQDALAI